jgi:hypothetical protein
MSEKSGLIFGWAIYTEREKRIRNRHNISLSAEAAAAARACLSDYHAPAQQWESNERSWYKLDGVGLIIGRGLVL